MDIIKSGANWKASISGLFSKVSQIKKVYSVHIIGGIMLICT